MLQQAALDPEVHNSRIYTGRSTAERVCTSTAVNWTGRPAARQAFIYISIYSRRRRAFQQRPLQVNERTNEDHGASTFNRNKAAFVIRYPPFFDNSTECRLGGEARQRLRRLNECGEKGRGKQGDGRRGTIETTGTDNRSRCVGWRLLLIVLEESE